MSVDVDVLIVGAGPAGLSAGIVLAQHGLDALICERRRLPVDKVCGEGVMPTGVAHLAQLGVLQHVDSEHVRPFAGIRYRSAAGRFASAQFAEGPGLGIRRTALSAALADRARQIARLTIWEDCHVGQLQRRKEHIHATARGETIRTRLLIGADGLNSRVRRWAGLDGGPGWFKRWGARQHFRMAPWSDYVEVHWQNGVEAYITPSGPHQVGVAFLWEPKRYQQVAGGDALIPSLLHAFPHLEARLADVPRLDTPRAVGPLQRTATAPIADGLLLIGDAAGYLDAITGEGISLATAQALCLARTVVPVLQAKKTASPTVRELAGYARAHGQIVGPYRRMTGLVLLLSRFPWLVERIVRALDQQPHLFRHLLSANMGLTSPWSLGVRPTLRLLVSLLSPLC